MTPAESAQFASARREKQRLAELEGNPMFLAFLAEVQSLATHAAMKHEAPTATPTERAEWLYAMKHGRQLSGWLEEKKAALDKILNANAD